MDSFKFSFLKEYFSANNQVLFSKAPKVHSPGRTGITKEGPALHFCVPRFSPPLGISITGQMPQVTLF